MNRLNFGWVIDGKLAGHAGPSCVEDLAWLKEQGVLAFVRMAEKHEQGIGHQRIEQMGFRDCYVPIPDFTAPNLTQVKRMVEFIYDEISSGRPVGVSCGAGLGRTGTVLACYLVSLGHSAPYAIDEVRAKRPGSIETEDQEDCIHRYQASFMP